MIFYYTTFGQPKTKLGVHLTKDGWNDFGYYTLYRLYLVGVLTSHDIGFVKIGMTGEDNHHTIIPNQFEKLDNNYFSLGQGKEYYKNLNKLSPQIRDSILEGLNDIANDLVLFEQVLKLDIVKESLLRDIKAFTVKSQFHRLAKGGVPLTPYQFSYRHTHNDSDTVFFNFKVEPDSMPPTNIHALIGSNGVGKTTIINSMINSILKSTTYGCSHNCFYDDDTQETTNLFANTIFVSFSAFDNTPHFRNQIDEGKGALYSYVGLKDSEIITDKNGDSCSELNERYISKNLEVLINDFLDSLKRIKDSKDLWKIYKWEEAISMLESDPIFKSFELRENISEMDKLKDIYNSLSSGHKIILLTVTKIIENVDEKSLVILDEPEAYLHPPLLSAFIRALSYILISRNGVAIIATHSPVILQELPRSCISIIRRRSSNNITVHRPEIETFGENVGTITREVFGLEVTYSGFHRILEDLVEKGKDYDEITNMFNGELGIEARTMLRSLLHYKG